MLFRSNIKSIYFTSLQLKYFSQYLPFNDRTVSMTNNLFNITEGLYKKEDPSDAYCKSKLSMISKASEEIQQVIGSRPR